MSFLDRIIRRRPLGIEILQDKEGKILSQRKIYSRKEWRKIVRGW